MRSRFRRGSLSCERGALDLRVEQDVERFPGLPVHGVVGHDDELVEEGLVGQTAQGVVNAHVDRVAVSGEGEAVFEVGLGLVVLDVSCVDLSVEERQAAGDAFLFLAEQVERDHAGVVGLEQLLALVAERVSFGGVGVALVSGGGVESVELSGDQLAERGDDVAGYLHAAVVVLDGGFDVGHEHGLAFAGGALGVPARAQEVGVDHSLAAAGVGQDQPGAALAAEDAAFEVVVVGVGLLPGGLVRGEDGLHPVPDLGSDQRFVQPVVGGATEADLSFVVRVGEHLLDR
ncbi:MAG: hypothetical protein U0R23_05265 [Candidatus Nanopelagicales bacterium]